LQTAGSKPEYAPIRAAKKLARCILKKRTEARSLSPRIQVALQC
jgi:hypothetical protein